MAAAASYATVPNLPPAATDPVKLYGDTLAFDIERNGERVGQYVVSFRSDEGRAVVETRAAIDIDLLFFNAYRFRYQAREIWRGRALEMLAASTNENGEYSNVDANRDGQSLRVRASARSYETPLVPPTTHWNATQLTSGVLLNTLTGQLNRVEVDWAGNESVETLAGAVQADHFVYSGDLEVEVWYDANGRWVKLRFLAEDGSTIEYVCRTCRPPATGSESG
ncbi:MAG: hypothetical protein HC869_12505 [Rhodospirillales bacterium]|nr:hypothetical protein [Rhodospirillales bacterium]